MGTFEQRWAYCFRMGSRQKSDEKIANYQDFLAWWKVEKAKANRMHERELEYRAKHGERIKERKESKKEPKGTAGKKERGKKPRGPKPASRA